MFSLLEPSVMYSSCISECRNGRRSTHRRASSDIHNEGSKALRSGCPMPARPARPRHECIISVTISVRSTYYVKGMPGCVEARPTRRISGKLSEAADLMLSHGEEVLAKRILVNEM